jgi:hypothetical protein
MTMVNKSILIVFLKIAKGIDFKSTNKFPPENILTM